MRVELYKMGGVVGSSDIGASTCRAMHVAEPRVASALTTATALLEQNFVAVRRICTASNDKYLPIR